MKTKKNHQYRLILVLSCLMVNLACQQSEKKEEPEEPSNAFVYQPKQGTFMLVSEAENPEVESVSLFSDNQKDSIASAKIDNGKFSMEQSGLNMNEVYFLRIKGKSTKRGTSGIAWQEVVPVLAQEGKELKLAAQPFNDVGSISKVKYTIEGGGEEQEVLNHWHSALVDLEAEKGSETASYTLGGGGATKVSSGKKSTSPESLTEDFTLKQDAPMVSTFFLITESGKFRQHQDRYQKLLDQASENVRSSKYGIRAAKHLDRLQSGVKSLNLKEQIRATDTRLQEIPWEEYADKQYLLLSFWNSADAASSSAAAALEQRSEELDGKGVALLHISVENQFTKWQEAAKENKFKNSFKMRNEAQQPLIDTLYLTDLPRLILVKTDGEVMEDDMTMEEVNEL